MIGAGLVLGSLNIVNAVQPAYAQDRDQDRTRSCDKDGTCDQTPDQDRTRDQDKLRTKDMDKLHDQGSTLTKDQLKAPAHPVPRAPLPTPPKVKSGSGGRGHSAN